MKSANKVLPALPLSEAVIIGGLKGLEVYRQENQMHSTKGKNNGTLDYMKKLPTAREDLTEFKHL